MPQACLNIAVPERIWIGTFSRDFPETVVRVLAAFTDDAGVGLAEVDSDDLSAVPSAMTEFDDLDGFEVLRRTDSSALVQFETTAPLLLLPARDSGVPIDMPVEIVDGTVIWEVTAPRDRLAALADQLDRFDVGYDVGHIRDDHELEPLTTERQHRVVTAAVEADYYDAPRTLPNGPGRRPRHRDVDSQRDAPSSRGEDNERLPRDGRRPSRRAHRNRPHLSGARRLMGVWIDPTSAS